MRLVLAFMLLAGCTPALGRRVPQTDGAPPTAGTRSGAAPLVTKLVAAKRAPGTLIAEDATTCEMEPGAFAGTRVGTMVRCAWMRGPQGGADAPAGG